MAISAVLAIALAPALGCSDGIVDVDDDDGDQEDRFFEVTNLVTDTETAAPTTDRNLVNPWGLAFGPTTYFWVANAGTATSTLYDGDGRSRSESVGGPIEVPTPTGVELRGYGGDDEEAPGPTGLVYSGSSGFEIEAGVPSRFIFATTAGTILGWSADADNPRRATMMVDNSAAGAVYTGLAITTGAEPRLLAANFADATIDVFDADFTPVELGGEAFADPLLPDEFAPFGIQEIRGAVYVAYAMKDPDTMEEITGAGRGWVSVFDADDGMYVGRIEATDRLDAPWGLAIAPSDFGRFDDALLVGNFGDGRITAFDADDYQLLGQLETREGEAVAIDGLWAIAFGNDALAGESDELYFTAGPDEERHGVFGNIDED